MLIFALQLVVVAICWRSLHRSDDKRPSCDVEVGWKKMARARVASNRVFKGRDLGRRWAISEDAALRGCVEQAECDGFCHHPRDWTFFYAGVDDRSDTVERSRIGQSPPGWSCYSRNFGNSSRYGCPARCAQPCSGVAVSSFYDAPEYVLRVTAALQAIGHNVDVLVEPRGGCDRACMLSTALARGIPIDGKRLQVCDSRDFRHLGALHGLHLNDQTYATFVLLGTHRLPALPALGGISVYTAFPRDDDATTIGFLSMYDAVVFSDHYSRRHWNVDAALAALRQRRLPEPSQVVLHPPVDLAPETTIRSKPATIVYVATKCQLDAIDLFDRLKRELAGRVAPRLIIVGADANDDVRARARDDVHLVTDAAVIANSSVVWSLTGLGDDSCGGDVARAMSAGAIPVVFDKALLRDALVADAGYVCTSIDDVVKRTLEVLTAPIEEQTHLRRAARRQAETVSPDRFSAAFQELVHQGHMSSFWRLLRINTWRRKVRAATPEESGSVAAIVETRVDVVVPVVVKATMLMLPCDWRLHVFHGASNGDFMRRALSDVENTRYTQINDITDQDTYSRLLKTPWFWTELAATSVLIFQADSLLVRPGAHAFAAHAYVGAPWHPDNQVYSGLAANRRTIAPLPRNITVGNGGLSLRSTRAMLAVLNLPHVRATLDDDLEAEDVFFARHLASAGYATVSTKEAAKFAQEVPHPDFAHIQPVGVHRIWKYTDVRQTGAHLRTLLHNLQKVTDC